MSLLIKTFILLPFCNSPLDSWDLNLKAPASHCIPLIKPRKQRGSELDSQECIYLFILFIIFAVPILPAAALQRWHLFSQTTRLFPPSCCFKLFSKDMCQTLPDERPRLHIGKIWIFPLFLPLWNVRLSVPSSPHVLSIKELGHCASKFEQTNSHVEIVHPNKLQSPVCPGVVYLCCLWAACGEEVYIMWSKRHQTKWPPEATRRQRQPSFRLLQSRQL